MEANAAVYISDKAVDHKTKTALQSGVAKLEAASEKKRTGTQALTRKCSMLYILLFSR
jgi:hypothetical protein